MNLMIKSLIIAMFLTSAAHASTFKSMCSRISNDLPLLGEKDLSFRLSVCENASAKNCVKIVETEKFRPVKGDKAFEALFYFKFTDESIEQTIKSKNWDREKARLEYGYLINDKYRPDGNTLWLLFHSSSLKRFDSSTRVDKNTGVVDTQYCEVINITD